ncbi:DUF58 domain-containing protein [Algoriphagus namhaensis]
MASAKEQQEGIFISLKELLGMEHLARQFSFAASRQKVSSILGGKHASKLRGRGLDFEEVRMYEKGDDIRTIDWKVTARTQVTHSRVYSEEKEKPALIVVDQSKSMFFGSQKRMKSVVAAELAALAAFRVLKEGDRVGGMVFSDEGIDILYPKRDRRNILRFLEKVAERNQALDHSEGLKFEESLQEITRKIRNTVSHDFLVIIISDFVRYSPDVIKFIAQIAQHNDVILAKVSDPMEREIPAVNFVAGDQDSQITVKGKDKSLRKKFEEGFDEKLLSFQSTMKKHRIPVLEIDTVRPVDEQLKELFKTKRR